MQTNTHTHTQVQLKQKSCKWMRLRYAISGACCYVRWLLDTITATTTTTTNDQNKERLFADVFIKFSPSKVKIIIYYSILFV